MQRLTNIVTTFIKSLLQKRNIPNRKDSIYNKLPFPLNDLVYKYDYYFEGKEYRKLEGHTEDILDIKIFKDRVISSSRDKTLRVWDLHTGKQLFQLTDNLEIL